MYGIQFFFLDLKKIGGATLKIRLTLRFPWGLFAPETFLEQYVPLEKSPGESMNFSKLRMKFGS